MRFNPIIRTDLIVHIVFKFVYMVFPISVLPKSRERVYRVFPIIVLPKSRRINIVYGVLLIIVLPKSRRTCLYGLSDNLWI
jgi:hypothetical protein